MFSMVVLLQKLSKITNHCMSLPCICYMNDELSNLRFSVFNAKLITNLFHIHSTVSRLCCMLIMTSIIVIIAPTLNTTTMMYFLLLFTTMHWSVKLRL